MKYIRELITILIEVKKLWKELFNNSCILTAIFFIASQIFKDTGISPKSPTKTRILLGVVGGVSAVILIYFSIHVSDKMVLDFRHILEIFIAFFGGLLSIVITGVITSIYRLFYQGISYEAIVSSIGLLVVSIGCGIISKFKLTNKLKLILMFAYTIIIRSILYYILLCNNNYAISIIAIFCGTTIIVGLAVSYLVQYLVTAHKLLNNLKHESTHDFLTGLSNTRQFDLKYNQILSQAIDNGQKVSLMIIDIDHFKNVNDIHGHIAGDEVLKELGQLLLKGYKDTGFVARIGGEEFTVVFQNLTKVDTLKIAESIRSHVESNSFRLSSGTKLKITISIGAAIYPDTVDNIIMLKELADTKLYEAKHSGRNRVCI